MTRHLDNVEGALPLLIIGSVLLVYAGILAGQQMGSHSHLPLWGLFGGVGAVIVGAGIYSTFLEPAVPPAPKPSDDWVTVPRAEWEARSKPSRPPERTPASVGPVPIWWEGPPASGRAPTALRASPASRTRADRGPSPPRSPSTPERPTMPAATVPRPTARYSYRALLDELSELEALVYRNAGTSPRKPSSPPPSAPPRSGSNCTDCDRLLTAAASPSPCRTCGRGLCAACAASSRAEDGEVRCVDCRARES